MCGAQRGVVGHSGVEPDQDEVSNPVAAVQEHGDGTSPSFGVQGFQPLKSRMRPRKRRSVGRWNFHGRSLFGTPEKTEEVMTNVASDCASSMDCNRREATAM